MNQREKAVIKILTEKMDRIARGDFPPSDSTHLNIPEMSDLLESISRLGVMLSDAHEFISALSQGRLDINPPSHNPLIAPFKQMHANLRHLTWQTKQIAEGDLDQHVDFLGSFSVAFNRMIEALREKRAAEEKIHYLSMHDALTDLYNRSYFEEEMKRVEQGRAFPVSILMADLDGLKKINDTQGHAAGDRLIKDAAEILRRSVRTNDVIARMGGDEFALILPETDFLSALGVVERIRRTELDFNRESALYKVGFSLGVATSGPGELLSETLKNADEMMYRDKTARKNGNQNERR